MSVLNISNRYAKALLELSLEKKNYEKISEDILLINSVLESSKELRLALASPIIAETKKRDILIDIFQSKISDDTLNFLKFVVEKNRQDMLYNITSRFIELRNEREGICKAKIYSAIELDQEQKEKLKKILEEKTSKKIEATFLKDESLIGGFKVRINDTVYDLSVANNLSKLKLSLLKEQEN